MVADNGSSTENGIPLYIPILAAFIGATIAFLFEGVRKWVAEEYQQEKKNWNGLIKLNLLIDTNRATNSLNISLAEDYLQKLRSVKSWPPVVPFEHLDVIGGMVLEINNLDLINDIRILDQKVKSFNKFLSDYKIWFYDFRGELLQRKVEEEVAKKCKENRIAHWTHALGAIKALDMNFEDLIAKIRSVINQTSLLRRFVKRATRASRYPYNFDRIYRGELVRVQAEREKIQQDNKKKIDEMEKS